MTITAPVFLDMKARTARTVSRSIVFTLCMIFKPVLLGDTYVDVSPFDFVKIFIIYLFIYYLLFFLEFVRRISQD